VRKIGAFEAKSKLGQLLDRVARGEEIIITRHGKEVARLVPVRPARDREIARAAIKRIRLRRTKQTWAVRLGGVEIIP